MSQLPADNTSLGAAVLANMAVALSAVVTGRLAIMAAFCYRNALPLAVSYMPSTLVVINWMERALQAHQATMSAGRSDTGSNTEAMCMGRVFAET